MFNSASVLPRVPPPPPPPISITIREPTLPRPYQTSSSFPLFPFLFSLSSPSLPLPPLSFPSSLFLSFVMLYFYFSFKFNVLSFLSGTVIDQYLFSSNTRTFFFFSLSLLAYFIYCVCDQGLSFHIILKRICFFLSRSFRLLFLVSKTK